MGNLLATDWAEWTRGGTTASVDTDLVQSAPNSLKLRYQIGVFGARPYARSPAVDADSGQYPLKFYVYPPASAEWFHLAIYDSAGNLVDTITPADVVEGDWTLVSYLGEHAPVPGYVEIRTVRDGGVEGNIGIWYVDTPWFGNVDSEGGAQVIAATVAEWIEDQGHGTRPATIGVSAMPMQPEDYIAVYDESAGSWSESQGLAIDRFGVQIQVRREAYEDARDKIIEIHKALSGVSGVLVAGTPHVIMVEATTAPTFLERDSRNRSVWVAHYVFTVQSTGDAIRQ